MKPNIKKSKMVWDKKDKRMESMSQMKSEGEIPTKDMKAHAKKMGCKMKGC